MMLIEDNSSNSINTKEEGLELEDKDLHMKGIEGSIMKKTIPTHIKKVREWKKININIEDNTKLKKIIKIFKPEILNQGIYLFILYLNYVFFFIFLYEE